MAEKLMPDFDCEAPRFVDFDATESSSIDDFFNGPVSLWSKDNMEVSGEIIGLSEDDKNESKRENQKTPSNLVIENIKKNYRIPTSLRSSTPSSNVDTSKQESPELEYTRPWLNKTCSSLISAMDALKLGSNSNRISLTPCNERNFNDPMETSTPFITVKNRSNTRFVENRIQRSPECRRVQSNEISAELELQGAQNSEFITDLGFGANIELKTLKCSGNNGAEGEDDNSKDAKVASGHSSDQIVPINKPYNEGNPEINGTKEVTENFPNDLAKNSESSNGNILERNQHPELDENFKDATAELSKIDSHVDQEEEKDEIGRKTKTRKPGVVVNKARRQSLKFRRHSGKFVSMAEAILKFQKGTPKRFYSTKRMTKVGSSQSAKKLTIATSPVLMCKSRCKRTIASNQQQDKEKSEKNAAKCIGTLKKITQSAPTSSDKRKNVVRDKSENRNQKTTKNPTENIKATTSAKVKALNAEPETLKKTKSGLATRTAKTSSELSLKTTRKIGGPSSKNDKEKIAPGATIKLETKTKIRSTCALSFEERNKLLLKKREEFAKRVIEEEKQKRKFHARPAPTFKTVTVHGSSTDNLKIHETKQQNVRTLRKQNSSCALKNQENRSPLKTVEISSMENLKVDHHRDVVKTPRMENPSCGSAENDENRSPFRTEERCGKRRLFDAEIKKKEEEKEAQRRAVEIEKLQTMNNQDKEFRKRMESKAKPLPTFKHPQIAKSKKPLTEPQSPAWSRKPKK